MTSILFLPEDILQLLQMQFSQKQKNILPIFCRILEI